jgi:hypothetical protein
MTNKNTTARRYTSPATPPPLTTREPLAATPAPLVCLRCGYNSGAGAVPLVTFAWGGLTRSRPTR